MPKKILSIGFGDIARRFSPLFLRDQHQLYAIARSPKQDLPNGISFIQADVASSKAKERLSKHKFDAVVITLTPDGADDDAYNDTYVKNLEAILNIWEKDQRPGLVIFISSSSVYHQSQAEWVDENSSTIPKRHTGRRLLEAEALLNRSELPQCIIRFSGIYGPGRHYLLKQVSAGKKGGSHYGNRIHVDDCAGIIHFLCEQHWQGNRQHSLYLASDSKPCIAEEVHYWLAEQLGLGAESLCHEPGLTRAGNKRCINRRLIESGYTFLYPNYQEGYLQVLRLLGETKEL